MPDIISRKEAEAAGLTRFYTGKPCRNGHVAERFTCGGSCVACNRVNRMKCHNRGDEEKKLIAENREKIKRARTTAERWGKKTFRVDVPCKRGHTAPRYVKGGRCSTCIAEDSKAWAEANPERFREAQLAAVLRYQRKNAARISSRSKELRDAKAAPMREAREEAKRNHPDTIARENARKRGERRYSSVTPCKRKWHDPGDNEGCVRTVRQNTCVSCDAASRKEWYAENREHRLKYLKKHNKKARGKLRIMCRNTAERILLHGLGHSRLGLLPYSPEEFVAHLEGTISNGMTLREAQASGWHVDHIVPISFISDSFPEDEAGRTRAFQVAMDLCNLRLIPGFENMSKGASMKLTAEQAEVFETLCHKYDVWDEMLARAVPY